MYLWCRYLRSPESASSRSWGSVYRLTPQASKPQAYTYHPPLAEGRWMDGIRQYLWKRNTNTFSYLRKVPFSLQRRDKRRSCSHIHVPFAPQDGRRKTRGQEKHILVHLRGNISGDSMGINVHGGVEHVDFHNRRCEADPSGRRVGKRVVVTHSHDHMGP
jgi:hypothetical protein